MPPSDISGIMRGKILEQLDVCNETGAGIAALQEIVTENPIFGKTISNRLLEGVEVIYAFANKGALEEQVLVYIRDSLCIGIDARVSGENLGEMRSSGA